MFYLVKQAGKDASYVGVLLLGFGVTGIISQKIRSSLLSIYTQCIYLRNHLLAFMISHEVKYKVHEFNKTLEPDLWQKILITLDWKSQGL